MVGGKRCTNIEVINTSTWPVGGPSSISGDDRHGIFDVTT